MKAFWAMFMARTKEFYRDKAGLGWNIIFPFLIIAGFAAIFGRGESPAYKMGVIFDQELIQAAGLPENLANSKFFSFIEFQDVDAALQKLAVHKIDIVVQIGASPVNYWISDSSPKGAIAGEILAATLTETSVRAKFAAQQTISGRRIHYIDWLFPGILAMNMMFSALFGVGFVVVRYRKNGVLKRLAATPLSAFVFLSAQVASRMLIILGSTALVYLVCALVFGFECQGPFWVLVLVFLLGGTAHISLALVMASKSASEEFTSGLLNVISWPMMFLSEVWFSLEGAPDWVKLLSKTLPLTHVTDGMREVMNQGAGFMDIMPQMAALAAITAIFLAIGSWRFKWTEG